MQAARILRQKIERRQVVTGALASFHFWPGLVELVKRAGLDYLIIDLEHLTHQHEAVGEACAIGRMIDFPVLVRPPSAAFEPIRVVFDLGPCGLLVPYVESTADVEQIKEGVYMRPRGRRRPGGLGNFWVGDYNYATWKREVEDDVLVIPQIESRRGLQAVDQIAAHPLVTAVGVGPYDLATDLGVCWDPDAPALQAALTRIREAAANAGKPAWMIGDGPKLVAQGFTFVCIGEPILMMGNVLRQVADATRGAQARGAAPEQAGPPA